ncbi:MAG: GTP cyclohydrolase II [Pseudomonadota bacterium]
MTLSLTAEERIARARSDLRMGAPIALVSEAGGALVLSAETITDPRLGDLRALGPSFLDLVITDKRAETLKARAYDGKLARIVLGPEADARFIRATADPATDLAVPMKGPYRSRRDGPFDLHAIALQITKQARILPAAVLAVLDRPEQAVRIANEAGLTLLTDEMVEQAGDSALRLSLVSGARVPTKFAKAGKCHVFRPGDGAEEHYAVEVGQPARDFPVLSRLHSACFTGDVIGSLKCDCGPQLAAAMSQIAAAGAGVLLYMNQEGRGIGLANKMRAYALQDQGFDTVEANHRLGFEDDERDFRLGASILKTMGFSSVRLMTNNPAKVAMMEASGIAVAERVALKVGETDENRAYLATKAKKSGHLL